MGFWIAAWSNLCPDWPNAAMICWRWDVCWNGSMAMVCYSCLEIGCDRCNHITIVFSQQNLQLYATIADGWKETTRLNIIMQFQGNHPRVSNTKNSHFWRNPDGLAPGTGARKLNASTLEEECSWRISAWNRYGVSSSSWGYPFIAGWFRMGNPSINGWFRGTPILGNLRTNRIQPSSIHSNGAKLAAKRI